MSYEEITSLSPYVYWCNFAGIAVGELARGATPVPEEFANGSRKDEAIG